MENDPREIPGDPSDVTGGRLAGIAATALSLSVALVSTATLLLAWDATNTTRDVQRDLTEEVREHRERDQAHICRTFMAQRGIEALILDIVNEPGAELRRPRLVPDPQIRGACEDAGIKLSR